MRHFLALLAVTLLAAFVGTAAEPVPEQNPVPVNSFAVVKYKLDKGEDVEWDVVPEPTIVKNFVADGHAVVHFNGTPGKYRVTADAINWDAKKRKKWRTEVTIGGVRPDPGPQPEPRPEPAPEPAAPIRSFVVVEDTAASGSWRGAILGAPLVASWYAATFGPGVHHRLIDSAADGDDPVAKEYKQKAQGKKLPYLWALGQDGKVVKEGECPTASADAFIAFFDTHKGKRALGAILEKPKLKWQKFGSTPSTPLIPRDQWKDIDLSAFLPAVYDQDGVGQCASSASCTLLEACRTQAGLKAVKLSAGDLYSRVNGGRDQGSLPEENLSELISNGVCPAANVPYIWNGRKYTDAGTVAARKPYRIEEAYLCDSFDACVSALQQGFLIQSAIWWYDNDSVDANGWLPAQGRGGRGGHALASFGVVKSDGKWGIKTRNSWGTGWGNSRDGKLGAGNCVIPESRYSFEFGAVWAVRSVYQSQTRTDRDPFAIFAREHSLTI